jgi:hypothetical protein
MTRFVTSANETAFDQEHVDFAIAASLDFASGVVRAHMGIGELTINGNVFYGVGSAGNGGFGSLSSIIERPDSRDLGQLKLALSGVDTVLVGKVPTRAEYYGRFASIYFIPLDSLTMQPLLPIEAAIFEGFMDMMVYQRRRGNATVELTVKHYDSKFQDAIGLLYTDEHQKLLFSSDNYFDQLPAIQNKEVVWGGDKVDPANIPTFQFPSWFNFPRIP